MSASGAGGPASGTGPAPRRRWYWVAGATSAVALLAGGAAVLLTFSPTPASRPLTAGCGLVACGASLPPAVTGLAAGGTAQAGGPHHPGQRPAPSKPAAQGLSPTPSPSPAALPPGPSPTPIWTPPPSQVTVTWTLDQGNQQGNQGDGRSRLGDGQRQLGAHPWHHGFLAHLTIVNSSSLPISGWTIQLTLPGDQVSSVGYPGARQQFAAWQFDGGTLTLNAVSADETLTPGGTEIVPISASGATTTPGGCTFNGSGCRA